MLKATCAIPLAFPVIKLNGKEYYDGGIADPIPVRQALSDGCEKLLIVLTRPKSYSKTLSKANIVASRVLKRKYPCLCEPLLTRHVSYNETVKYCEELEKQGKAIILRPNEDVMIDSFEKDLQKIQTIYDYGYNLTEERIEDIKKMLD